MLINNSHEIFYDLIWWCGTVNKEKVIVAYIIFCKRVFIVKWVIESNYLSNSNILEQLNVLGRMVAVSLLGISLFDWPHECSKLIRDDPVHVTVFYSLIVLILFDVESFELIPSEFQSPFQAL